MAFVLVCGALSVLNNLVVVLLFGGEHICLSSFSTSLYIHSLTSIPIVSSTSDREFADFHESLDR